MRRRFDIPNASSGSGPEEKEQRALPCVCGLDDCMMEWDEQREPVVKILINEGSFLYYYLDGDFFCS
jgi:hypothetical protein